jgi:hypothetical protein
MERGWWWQELSNSFLVGEEVLLPPGFGGAEGSEARVALVSEAEEEADEEDAEAEEEREWRNTEQLQKDMREACGGPPHARLQSTTRFCKVLLVCPPACAFCQLHLLLFVSVSFGGRSVLGGVRRLTHAHGEGEGERAKKRSM